MTVAQAALASDALTTALRNLAARSERTHCSDPTTYNYWLSEHAQIEEIQRAAKPYVFSGSRRGCRTWPDHG